MSGKDTTSGRPTWRYPLRRNTSVPRPRHVPRRTRWSTTQTRPRRDQWLTLNVSTRRLFDGFHSSSSLLSWWSEAWPVNEMGRKRKTLNNFWKKNHIPETVANAKTSNLTLIEFPFFFFFFFTNWYYIEKQQSLISVVGSSATFCAMKTSSVFFFLERKFTYII